jgi:hypothetical protein
MYQQLWGYKVEDKLYLGVSEQKRLNTTGLVVFNPRFTGSNTAEDGEFLRAIKSLLS